MKVLVQMSDLSGHELAQIRFFARHAYYSRLESWKNIVMSPFSPLF